jgi:hypothetical protein
MHLIQNERTKLTATSINTLAAALIAAGGVAPIAAILYGLSMLPVSAARTFALAFACVGLGIGIHAIARISLGSLRE